MPIITRKCAGCHAKDGRLPVLDTSAGAAPIYQTLMAADAASSDAVPRGKYVDPGRARTSRLVWHLFGRNAARPWDCAAGSSNLGRDWQKACPLRGTGC